MDKAHFIFSETVAALALVFLSLLSVKAVGGLRWRGPEKSPPALVWIRSVLYVAIAALAIWGARGFGSDLAAGLRALASESDIQHTRFVQAYVNASRAVELRPNVAIYWRELSVAKFFLNQYQSALEDEPAYRALKGSEFDQEASMRYSYCHYALGQYAQVFPLTEQVIRENPMYPLPYIVEAMAYTAEKKYAHAMQRYLDALKYSPDQEACVVGLAHVHYLMGDPGGALEVLNATAKISFPPEARKRFDDLKAFYAQ
ncbi:MAG: hypothetical protein ABSB82_20185 [Terriglobia bacterium]|jgi:tetratricopeptide (TPR) repeat protein